MTKPYNAEKSRPSLRIASILVAAGKGTRAGGPIPKQYQMLGGQPLLCHAMRKLTQHATISQCIVVISELDEVYFKNALAQLSPVSQEKISAVYGGENRQASVLNGLEALAENPPDLVLIHDGARPHPSEALMNRVIEALQSGTRGVIPGADLSDTIKSITETGSVGKTLDRSQLRRVQTPQGFWFENILDAHRAAEGEAYTDDAAVAEAYGMVITFVEGDERNIKITHNGDLQREEALIFQGKTPRVGTGFDVHRFEEGNGLWLCGVFIPHIARLRGHSDADVGLHALTDAILGAAALGDIGEHFPPSDPQWEGANSAHFLEHACTLLRDQGGTLTHLDVTLICERPKLGPHKKKMQARIAEIAGLPTNAVSVKATTTEKLGFTGREEGIAAQAVATAVL